MANLDILARAIVKALGPNRKGDVAHYRKRLNRLSYRRLVMRSRDVMPIYRSLKGK